MFFALQGGHCNCSTKSHVCDWQVEQEEEATAFWFRWAVSFFTSTAFALRHSSQLFVFNIFIETALLEKTVMLKQLITCTGLTFRHDFRPDHLKKLREQLEPAATQGQWLAGVQGDEEECPPGCFVALRPSV
jgi:hypothetical protein